MFIQEQHEDLTWQIKKKFSHINFKPQWWPANPIAHNQA